MPYDIESIRKKLKQSMSGKYNDPDEFKPEKAKSTSEAIKYRFFILPPIMEGDLLKSGKVARGMENQFFVSHGDHWVNDKPYPCPRVWTGDPCKVCNFGFDLLKDEKIKSDDVRRAAVVKQWMPTQYYMMNVFFPAIKENPEELRNRVMFYNAPKTVIDICQACIMRDDAGDPENPEAFGVFFDETNGFVFELQVLKQGRNNSYKTSKFLAAPRPVVRNQDGTINPKAVSAVLTLRHNLFDKINVPSPEKIDKLFEVMQNGADPSELAGAGGFDNDETAAAAAPAKHPGKTDPGAGAGVATAAAKATTTTKAPAKASPKPAVKAEPIEEDDAASLLAAAASVEETPAPAKKSPAAAVKLAKAPAAAPVAEALDGETPVLEESDGDGNAVSNSEIDNLLGQLSDDD